MCNNQGIMHAAMKPGSTPLCRNRNAHMSTAIAEFRNDPKPCKRCSAKLAKMDMVQRKRYQVDNAAD